MKQQECDTLILIFTHTYKGTRWLQAVGVGTELRSNRRGTETISLCLCLQRSHWLQNSTGPAQNLRASTKGDNPVTSWSALVSQERKIKQVAMDDEPVVSGAGLESDGAPVGARCSTAKWQKRKYPAFTALVLCFTKRSLTFRWTLKTEI